MRGVAAANSSTFSTQFSCSRIYPALQANTVKGKEVRTFSGSCPADVTTLCHKDDALRKSELLWSIDPGSVSVQKFQIILQYSRVQLFFNGAKPHQVLRLLVSRFQCSEVAIKREIAHMVQGSAHGFTKLRI